MQWRPCGFHKLETLIKPYLSKLSLFLALSLCVYVCDHSDLMSYEASKYKKAVVYGLPLSSKSNATQSNEYKSLLSTRG